MADSDSTSHGSIWPPPASEPQAAGGSVPSINVEALNLLRRVVIWLCVFYICFDAVWTALSLTVVHGILTRLSGLQPTVRAIHDWMRWIGGSVDFFWIATFALWSFCSLTNVSSGHAHRSRRWAASRALLLVTPFLRYVAIYPIMQALWRDSNALSSGRVRWKSFGMASIVGGWLVLLVGSFVLTWVIGDLDKMVPRSELYLSWYSLDVLRGLLNVSEWIPIMVYVNNVTNAQISWPTVGAQIGGSAAEPLTA